MSPHRTTAPQFAGCHLLWPLTAFPGIVLRYVQKHKRTTTSYALGCPSAKTVCNLDTASWHDQVVNGIRVSRPIALAVWALHRSDDQADDVRGGVFTIIAGLHTLKCCERYELTKVRSNGSGETMIRPAIVCCGAVASTVLTEAETVHVHAFTRCVGDRNVNPPGVRTSRSSRRRREADTRIETARRR